MRAPGTWSGRLAGAASAAMLGLAGAAPAATISLSDSSTDSTPADLLAATLEFDVSGIAGSQMLTLTLTNDTAVDAGFDVNRVFFNASSEVAGLVLQTAVHSEHGEVGAVWELGTATKAGGFGTFGFSLMGGVGGRNPNLIGPGESIVFSFAIAAAGPIDEADFVLERSDRDPKGTGTAHTKLGALAAAKFVNGPGGDSAFGATLVLPEPGIGALLATFVAGLAWLRRRP